MKSRHQQWQADKAELKQELATCRNAQKHHDSILAEKEKQISSLMEDLTTANMEIIKAKDEVYEAKRTQVINISADEFTPVASRKASRKHPPARASPESKTSSHPTTHTGISQPSRTYASVARATPRLNSERAPAHETSEIHERANHRFRSSLSKTTSSQTPLNRDKKRDKPTVVVIGNSHLTHVDTRRLVPQAHVTMLQAYTIDEAAQQLEHAMTSRPTPSCVVIHEITNDVKRGQNAKAIAESFQSVIEYHSTRYPETKFVISLGVCRVDNPRFNTITEIINAHLKGFVNSDNNAGNVTFCDHGNFTRNGNPLSHLLSKKDGYHLSNEGTKLLCSNIRCRVEKVLNIQSRYRQKIQDNHGNEF